MHRAVDTVLAIKLPINQFRLKVNVHLAGEKIVLLYRQPSI
jgi:hypothetical protein